MGKESKIEWTGSTWNPWIGCHWQSRGCDNCYAEALAKRMGRDFSKITATKTMHDPFKWKPRRVFTCSLSDFFHPAVPRDLLEEAWYVIRGTPQHTYQILTKRPQAIADRLPAGWPEGYEHVWLGTSTEDQHTADVRIPKLVAIPATVHFLSAEPLLGPIDFRLVLDMDKKAAKRGHMKVGKVVDRGLLEDIQWVIVGGESGPRFRTMAPNWPRAIQGACELAGVPFFYKQGHHRFPGQNRLLDGKKYEQMPEAIK